MFLFILFVLFTVIFLKIYVFYKKQFNYWLQHKGVASVPGRILSGNIADFLTFRTNFAYHLKTIYDDPKFADEPVVGVYGLYKPCLLIKDPDIIKSMLIRDFDSFHNRFAHIDGDYDPIGAQMMFFASYDLWKDMRSKFSPAFTSAKLKHMSPLIQSVGENIENYLGSQPSVHRVEMKDFCARYTTDIIATTVFGFESNSLVNPLEELHIEIRKSTDFSWRRAIDVAIVSFIPKFTRLFGSKIFYPETDRFLRASINQVVDERERTGVQRNDMIDIFVKLKREAAKNGEDVEKLMDCLTAQAGVFMVGGFETSSTTMSNALLELAKQPELQEKLRHKIRTVFQEAEGSISYEIINKMEYLDMVIYETLRLYPVFAVLERQYSQPAGKDEPYSLQPYCDFSLPEGMPVFVSTFGLHYDPKYWPNPTKFDPERFSSKENQAFNTTVYVPFGMGPRNCIGARLAMFQVKVGLLYLLKNHYVQVCDKTVLQPEFDAKSILLQINGGIYLEIVKDKMCDDE